jgi:Tfp pilus assembly protein PilN
MNGSTNLALRPFRNERLPWLLAGLLIAAAIATSFLHGRFVSRLLSGDEANTVRVVREDEARIAELEEGIAREPPLRIESAELARLHAFKELVDRRVFPWRRLLAELEGTLSEDVRLTRISPATAKGARGMLIELSGGARTKDAAFSLAEALDASPVFSNSVLKSLSENESETEFDIEVVFDPPDRSPAQPLASVTPATAPAAANSPRGSGKTS